MRANTQDWKVEMEHRRITSSVNMLKVVRGHQRIISVIGPDAIEPKAQRVKQKRYAVQS